MRYMPVVAATLFLFCAQLSAQESAPEIIIPEVADYSRSDFRGAAREQLQAVRRGEGGPADLADAAYAMESMLRRDGYPEALVTFSMFDTSGDSKTEVMRATEWQRVTRVEFQIQPGDRFLVGRISFEGVSVFTPERLREFFPGAREDESPAFRRQEIETAIGEVARLYELEGYAEARVGPMTLSRRETDEALFYDVEIQVQEGDLFVISDVSIEAPRLTAEQMEELRGSLGIEGQPFYPRRAAQGAITIRNLLGRDGYLAEVDYRIDRRPGAGTSDASGAAITYLVDSGPPLRVREIRVVPRNQEELRTRWWFLESFIPIEPGDRVNLEILNRSEDRLYALGLFRLVDLQAQPVEEDGEGENGSGSSATSGEPVPADIIIALTEIETREVQLSAGWGSYELATASATFTDRNIFGVGRYWSTTVHGSFKTYGVQTSLSDSILLGPNSTISLTGAYDFRDAPAYDITTVEGRVDLLFRLSSYWRLEGGYSFGLDRIGEAVEDEDVPSAAEYRTARISAGAVRDDRDSVVLPTDGTEVGGRFVYSTALIGSQLEYLEGSFFGNYHERLFRPLVFSMSWSGATRVPILGEPTLPIQERLFLGGANSVRSFTLDQLGPVGQSGDVIGGLTSAELTTELRLQVIESLHLAAFYDVGVVSRDTLSISGTWGQAIGAGARYYLPIGPIRLDLAYNPGDVSVTGQRWVLHFAVGFSY